jgi:16S rRNA processing protein RimM
MINYLKVGQIVNTHGVRGEVKVYPLTDDLKRFDKLKFVFIKSGDQYKKVQVQGVKYVKAMAVLKLSGIESMNDAEKYRDMYIYIDRENAIKLPEDTYFIADLIGMDVLDGSGNPLGKLTNVISTGSNDVYEIKPEAGKSFLIPAIGDVVKDVDVVNKKMVVELLEGLI